MMDKMNEVGGEFQFMHNKDEEGPLDSIESFCEI